MVATETKINPVSIVKHVVPHFIVTLLRKPTMVAIETEIYTVSIVKHVVSRFIVTFLYENRN